MPLAVSCKGAFPVQNRGVAQPFACAMCVNEAESADKIPGRHDEQRPSEIFKSHVGSGEDAEENMK